MMRVHLTVETHICQPKSGAVETPTCEQRSEVAEDNPVNLTSPWLEDPRRQRAWWKLLGPPGATKAASRPSPVDRSMASAWLPVLMPWIDGVWQNRRVVIEQYKSAYGARWLTADGTWTREVSQARIYADDEEARSDLPPHQLGRCTTTLSCQSHPDLRDPMDPGFGGPIPAAYARRPSEARGESSRGV